EHHLRKIVFDLSKQGLIETTRGRDGGIRLAKERGNINVGEIVRDLEQDFYFLASFDNGRNHCILSPASKLKFGLHEALESFVEVLDQYTLGDLIVNENELLQLMGL